MREDPGFVQKLVVLLRGINLGRNRRVSMAELRALLEEMGYAEVQTVLQSGNAVLASSDTPRDVARAVERRLAERLGMDVSVVIRTAAELLEVAAANPLGEVASDGSRYLVAFLSAEPDAGAVRELEAIDLAPELLLARGREVYLWCPDGVQNSAATKLVSERRLGVLPTVRNWNTVKKLAARLDDG